VAFAKVGHGVLQWLEKVGLVGAFERDFGLWRTWN
jgi:hypothetical protein